MKPYFSIVIPCYNEEILLPKLLKSIKNQTFTDYEVIVADNHSTDKSPEIIHEFGAKLVEGGNRPGISRNMGAEKAQGEFLLFLDADTNVNKSFLADLKKQIEKRHFGVASGFFKGDKGSFWDKIGYVMLNYYFWSLQKVDPHANGFYFVVRKDLFEKVGGFDPEVVMAEDHELADRLRKITKFSFLRYPRVVASVRRVSREGFLSTVGRGVYVEIYRIFNKRITKKLFDYRMGGGEGKLPE